MRLAFKRNSTAFPQLNIEKRPQLKKYSFFIVYLTGLCAVIGIIKQVYGQNDVYITPTMAEIDSLMETKAEIIATDATSRVRPDGKTLKQFYGEIRAKYPDVLLMADVSSIEEAKYADDLG
ncbi:UNVERIFIED_CONTAM: hypothetical protein FO527_29070, partial [Bacillus sp. ATCC 13368]